MGGRWISGLCIFVVAIAMAGCQTPNAVGAMGHAAHLLSTAAYTTAYDDGKMPQSMPMASRTPARPPPGFISFCIRMPDQCMSGRGTSSTITATPQVWNMLVQINDQVNDAIAPEDDERHYGRGEYWTIPTDGFGDCEDYALTKRKDLIAAGFPENALRVAVVLMWDGERHAVLTVSTDKGDLVLDNLRTAIRPWFATNYTWVERQAADNPSNWVALEGASPDILLAHNDKNFAATTGSSKNGDDRSPS